MSDNNVSVTSEAVKFGIGCCSDAIISLNETSRRLNYNLHKAGAGGWNDAKYAELSSIVSNTNKELLAPVRELNSCMETLKRLLNEINDYESTRLS